MVLNYCTLSDKYCNKGVELRIIGGVHKKKGNM